MWRKACTAGRRAVLRGEGYSPEKPGGEGKMGGEEKIGGEGGQRETPRKRGKAAGLRQPHMRGLGPGSSLRGVCWGWGDPKGAEGSLMGLKGPQWGWGDPARPSPAAPIPAAPPPSPAARSPRGAGGEAPPSPGAAAAPAAPGAAPPPPRPCRQPPRSRPGAATMATALSRPAAARLGNGSPGACVPAPLLGREPPVGLFRGCGPCRGSVVLVMAGGGWLQPSRLPQCPLSRPAAIPQRDGVRATRGWWKGSPRGTQGPRGQRRTLRGHGGVPAEGMWMCHRCGDTGCFAEVMCMDASPLRGHRVLHLGDMEASHPRRHIMLHWGDMYGCITSWGDMEASPLSRHRVLH